MARSASITASILSCFYDETFANDSCEAFRITWSDLRGIAGATKLTAGYLRRKRYAKNLLRWRRSWLSGMLHRLFHLAAIDLLWVVKSYSQRSLFHINSEHYSNEWRYCHANDNAKN